MIYKKPKIRIVEFTHDLIDPRIIHALTEQGERLTLTECIVPVKKGCKCPLYSDGKGHFFTLNHGQLGQVFDTFSPTNRTPGRQCHNGKRGNIYPHMRHFGNTHCHIIVLLTYLGPRPVGEDGKPFEADHKNGVVTDYSLDNLEWVSRKENARRRNVLAALRSIGINLTDVPYRILDVFLNKDIVSDMSVLSSRLKRLLELMPHCLTLEPDDFRRWLTMPAPDFDAMLALYTRNDS